MAGRQLSWPWAGVVAAPAGHALSGKGSATDEIVGAALIGLILVGLVVWTLLPGRKGRRQRLALVHPPKKPLKEAKRR